MSTADVAVPAGHAVRPVRSYLRFFTAELRLVFLRRRNLLLLAVTAVFGPTDDTATRPLGEAHALLTHPVWCRPCMLRECPIDHRCMRRITVEEVFQSVEKHMGCTR